MGRYIYDEFGNKLRFKGTSIHNSYSGAKQRCNYKKAKHYIDFLIDEYERMEAK